MTPVGRQLRDDLLPAYERMLRAVADAAAAYADISGTVRVGFTAPWSGELLNRAGDALSGRYPCCAVELLDVTYNAAIAALREKRVDLLVAEPPVEECDVVVGPVLFSERRALVVPTGHPLARRRTVSLEDLAVLPLVTASGVSKTFHEALFPSRTPGGRPIEHGPTAGGWQGVLSLVGAGKGATVATVAAGRYHVRPDIAYIPIDGAEPIGYALMWRDGDLAPGLRALIDIAADLAPSIARASCDCQGAGARQCQRCSSADQ